MYACVCMHMEYRIPSSVVSTYFFFLTQDFSLAQAKQAGRSVDPGIPVCLPVLILQVRAQPWLFCVSPADRTPAFVLLREELS